jgi:hypothetical protein
MDSALGGRSLSPPGKSRVGAFKDENDLAIFFWFGKSFIDDNCWHEVSVPHVRPAVFIILFGAL